MNSLGIQIAAARQARSLSLREVGSALSLSHEAIAKAERGETSLSASIRIAFFLGLSEEAILALLISDLPALVRAEMAAVAPLALPKAG